MQTLDMTEVFKNNDEGYVEEFSFEKEGEPQQQQQLGQRHQTPGSQQPTTLKVGKKIFKSHDYINFYNNLDWIGGSCKIETVIENGELKKKTVHCKGWNTTPKYYTHPSWNGFFWQTGKKNNMVVVDLDDLAHDHCKQMKEMAEKNCTMVVQTRKGFHYYFLYEEDMDKKKQGIEGFRTPKEKVIWDFQTTGQIIYRPPTKYLNISTNQFVEYKLLKCNKLVKMLPELKQFILDNGHESITPPKKESLPKEVISKPIQVETKTEVNTQIEKRGEDIPSLDKIDLVFKKCIKKERATNRKDWISAGMALKVSYGCDRAFDIWYEFSKLSTEKFPGVKDLQYRWEGFNENEGYTYKNILAWGYADNRAECNKIMGVEKRQKKVDREVDELEIATYLCSHYEHFFWERKTNNIYVWDNDEERWRTNDDSLKGEASGIIASFIKNDIYTYYKNLDLNYTNEELWKFRSFQTYHTVQLHTKAKDFKRYKNKINWDFEEELIAFDNGMLNLKTKKIEPQKPKHYSLKSCGYDYIEPTPEKRKEFQKFFASIFPNPNIRKFIRMYFGSILLGKPIQKFIILVGHGANGKGTLSKMLLKALGEYGTPVNSAILYEKTKTGNCDELASMSGMRLVIFQEGDDEEVNTKNKQRCISNAIMKKVSGGDTLTAMKKYGTDTTVETLATVFLESNKIPTLRGEVQEAEDRRIIIIPYESTFTGNKKAVDNFTTFLMDSKITNKWMDEMRCSLIAELLDGLEDFWAEDEKPELPEELERKKDQYLSDSSDIVNWIRKRYTKDSQEKFKVDEMLSLYNTDLDQFVPKMKKGAFINLLKGNFKIKKYFKERLPDDTRNWIMGLRLKPLQDPLQQIEEEEEDF